MYSTDFTGMTYRRMGDAVVSKTLSDIDIQTETPTISNSGGGFIHKSFSMEGDLGIVSGLFYDDYSIDDYNAMLMKRNDMRDGKLVPIWDEKSTGAWNSLLTQPYLTEEERQQEYVRVMRLQNNGNVLF